MKEIILPGDLVADVPIRNSNTYVENGKTYSMVLGMYEKEPLSIVPLEGVWVPRIEDTVVGIIASVRNGVYEVDLKFHGRSLIISGKFEKFSFNIGDMVEATIKNVEDKKTIILSYPRLLSGGTLITIKATKIPRIIGKENTMVKQIADSTKSTIVVGKNGVIWIKGGNTALAAEVILRIQGEAHVSGLTERIKKMMEERSR
jgi:exosome complex component RRP4